MKRALGLVLAATLALATPAAVVAQDAGREPVARAGIAEDGFMLPLRGAFEALYVQDCAFIDAFDEELTTASIGGMGLDVDLEPGVVVQLDLEPGPYAVAIEAREGAFCLWAFFLDPR